MKKIVYELKNTQNPVKSTTKNYDVSGKIVFDLKNHKVWPIRATEDSAQYCSCVQIHVQGRPWAHFETFSKDPVLFIYPGTARFLNDDVLKAMSRFFGEDPDPRKEDGLAYLTGFLHRMNLEVLHRRWRELSKHKRRYRYSRYFHGHMPDAMYSFVTQDHLNRLMDSADRELNFTEIAFRNVAAELNAAMAQPITVEGGNKLGPVGRKEQLALLSVTQQMRDHQRPPPPKKSPEEIQAEVDAWMQSRRPSIPENAPANAAMVFGDDEGDELSEAEYMAMVREDMRRVNDQEKFNK